MRPYLAPLLLAIAGCNAPAAATGDAAQPTDGGAGDLAGPVADGSTAPGDLAGPRLTVIRVHHPCMGCNIAIRGSAPPLDWNHGAPMVRTGGDGHTVEYVTAAFAGAVEFKPLLEDKTWSRGANYRVQAGATVDVYPHFNAMQGRVVKLLAPLHSAVLPDDRTVWAYLPPSYDENTDARFPVVYMQDGQNLFDRMLAFLGNEWKVDETLDAASEVLDHSQTIRELIVIGVENTRARIYEYTPTRDAVLMMGGGGDLYLELLVDELKPVVDRMLRTLPARETTAILGSSLGGLMAAHAGVKRPEVFGLVGAMSPSTWWDNRTIIGEVMTVKGQPTRALRVYLDSGDAGNSNDGVTDTNDLAKAYLGAGYQDGVDFQHVVQQGGQHSEVYGAQRLPGVLRFLVGEQQPW